MSESSDVRCEAGVRRTEQGEAQGGELSVPVSPPHLVSSSPVSDPGQERKATGPAAVSLRPVRQAEGQSIISVPPSQGCWEDYMS